MLPLSTNIHSAYKDMVLMFTGRFPLSNKLFDTFQQPDSLVTVKTFDDLPLIDLNPVYTPSTNIQRRSPEILRLESPKPESVIDHTPRGRYVLQRVAKRPLDVSFSFFQGQGVDH